MSFQINKKNLTKDGIFLILSFISLTLPIAIILNSNNKPDNPSLLSLLFLGYPIICLTLGFISGILKVNLLVELMLLFSSLLFIMLFFLNVSALIYAPFYIFLNIIAVLLMKNLTT
ncbi:hypothetical protein VT91_01460 [Clostridium sporogenes]|uniref:hypothetical protein n=1 Tax=Clostridium botulinum TaxID=1491 RepID=UPI000717766B|nr:hypothetical protein [Clostridium botulinum]KRU24681.1 hypothetical protein VT28_36370 [Clostridium sporogenes]KRU26426.1 hypothetical protein WG71_26310 [Clostridium sporogenes]KRU35622.1 hypothetical protein VT91_01460 [Clostridium sporogenes]KRU40688.1 hypothetical protein VT95_25610 [Clostridium sporogenes]MBZ1329662.1 hypothetical protein [Clostridium botulinum]